MTGTATGPTSDPTTAAPADSPTAARVQELRELAATETSAAREEAWSWFRELGALASDDRIAGEAELDALFRTGNVPKGLDGPTDGILVAPLIQPQADFVLRALTRAWMPWQGKRFDQAAQRGDNLLAPSARWAAKALWPRYSTTDAPGGRAAFEFVTHVEAGKVDPDVPVLVIDYELVDENPSFIIKRIRDELVEIVPGANLGKILYRTGNGYTNIGFFALRTDRG
jgi:hypothetical protein